jgi:DNA-binding response OmpR family regulator
MKGKRILVIDDESETQVLLKDIFYQKGAEVYIASDGTAGLSQIYAYKPDLVILDILMPKMDGWKTLEFIRQVSTVPVIILTALPENVENVTRGLDSGAADYISKPFDSQILISRAQAAIRMMDQANERAIQSIYRDEHLMIDLHNQQFFVDKKQIHLTNIERKLLAYLFRNAGRTITTDQILNNVWGIGASNQDSSVHVYISRLRQKIEKDPSHPCYLQTVHGTGYRVFWGETNQAA